jgi:hypothetical protein
MSFEAVLGNKEFELVVFGVTYFTQIIFSLLKKVFTSPRSEMRLMTLIKLVKLFVL